MVDRALALPDAPSLRIQRLDGGWLIVLAGLDVPLACRTAQQMLEDVRTFLGDVSPYPNLSATRKDPPLGSVCLLSKVDGGWLTTLILGQNQNLQLIRFTPRDTTLTVAGWAGFSEGTPSDVSHDPSSPSDESHP